MNAVRWIAAVAAFFALAFLGMFWFLEQSVNAPTHDAALSPRVEVQPAVPAVSGNDVAARPTVAPASPGVARSTGVETEPEPDSGAGSDNAPVAGGSAPAAGSDASPSEQNQGSGETQPSQLSASQPQRTTENNDARREPPPEGDETLGGRVLNTKGEIMSGVTVTAGYRDPVTRRINPRKLSSRVDDNGRYQFKGLAVGEYQLSHLPIPGYSNRTMYVRAGSASADLVLTAVSAIIIRGKVTSADGLPIPKATVVVSGGKTIITDAQGEYIAEATIQTNSAVAVRVVAPGYGDETLLINGREVIGQTETELDVVLQPLGEISVTGVLRAQSGEPVANELVRIFSARLKLSSRAHTDAEGRFTLTNLQEGDDFRLSIIPKNLYERLERGPLRIIPGMAPMELTLQAHSRGQVTGSIQTLGGNPLPGFTMSLTSSKSPATALVVRADETGRFVVDDVPSGDLHFSTPSQPHMDVRGVTLGSGDQVDVNVVVDIGPWRMAGTVTNPQGQPVPGANVVMTWRHQANGLSASSYRQTSTDASGTYQFTELASGTHSIAINHVDFGQLQSPVDVGPGRDRFNAVLPGN